MIVLVVGSIEVELDALRVGAFFARVQCRQSGVMASVAGDTWTGRGRMPRWMVAATKGANQEGRFPDLVPWRRPYVHARRTQMIISFLRCSSASASRCCGPHTSHRGRV